MNTSVDKDLLLINFLSALLILAIVFSPKSRIDLEKGLKEPLGCGS